VAVQYASKILTKEMLIKPKVLLELGQEERAVVDWLILQEARLAGVPPKNLVIWCKRASSTDETVISREA
jgi:hypothetical protein